jgi:hypothetical protein
MISQPRYSSIAASAIFYVRSATVAFVNVERVAVGIERSDIRDRVLVRSARLELDGAQCPGGATGRFEPDSR